VQGYQGHGDAGQGRGHVSLSASVAHWRAILARPATTPAELTDNLLAFYRSVYGSDFAAHDPAEVRALANAISDELFDMYLTVRDRVPEWRALGLMSQGAPAAARNALRVLRYTIDIVGEVANGYARLPAGEQTHTAFEGPPAWTAVHPARRADESVSPEPGDVLLVRGKLHNSAAIARIGDVDSQFSHVGLVHIDEVGERWLVEALIEEGSVWSPLGAALSHGLGRALLLRHRDRELARRAATHAAALVEQGRRGLLAWIPYDFSMELEGDDRFFCSKLVRHAYLAASDGQLRLPSFPTRLAMKNRDFFERIGVTATDTFAPGDLELEPAFDVVAEWRDCRVTSALRMQDLLMSKLFDWMDEHDYRFRERLGIGVMALLGRLSSWGPDLLKDGLVRLGFPKVPANMSARTIATIGMLHDTAQPILERLLALEDDRIRAYGRPLHPREVQDELERLRVASGGRIGYLATP
jgi:hypothetical protein